MKWIRFAASLLLCLTLVFPALADTFVLSPNSAPVNLREAPSTSSEILLKLVTGTHVTVLDTQDGWCQVVVGDDIGYIREEYVTEHDPFAALGSDANATYAYIQSPNDSPVNVRKEPDTRASLVDQLPTGTVVEVLGTTEGTGSGQGSDAGKNNGGGGDGSTGGNDGSTGGSDNGDEWTQIYVPGITGYVLSEFISDTMPVVSGNTKKVYETVYVESGNSETVNLREEPRGKIIARLVTGTEVELLEMGEEWTLIQVGEQTGYIMTKFLTAIRPSILSTPYTATLNATTRVRYGAGKGYAVVTSLSSGTAVTVLGTVKGWARIRCGYVEGYVEERYLSE